MQFDNRLTDLGVTVTPNPNGKWSLTSAVYQDENQAQGNHVVLFTLKDAQGQAVPNVTCFLDWVGRDPGDPPTPAKTDAQGQSNVPIYANLDITKKNGPYFVYVEGKDKSDIVAGMGLPEHHHVNFLLTYAPTTTTPPPTQTLEQAAQARADAAKPWMPVNNAAALWKFAKANGLQDQQTDELSFTYNGVDYICQVFNLGIVYCPKSDLSNIKIIRK